MGHRFNRNGLRDHFCHRPLSRRKTHHALRHRVQRRRRLVEQQHRRILQQHPRGRAALLLTAREAVAALADDGVVAVLEALDDVVDVPQGAGNLELDLSRVRPRVQQVLADGRVEEVGLLGHDPDVVDDRVLAQPPHIRARELDAALADVAPPITLVTGANDGRLNENGYIVPGLGGAGDRLYGLAQ